MHAPGRGPGVGALREPPPCPSSVGRSGKQIKIDAQAESFAGNGRQGCPGALWWVATQSPKAY